MGISWAMAFIIDDYQRVPSVISSAGKSSNSWINGLLVGGFKQPRCPSHFPASAAVLTERGRVRSLVAMDFPMRFSSTDVGSKMNLVSRLHCWDPGHDLHLFESVPDGVFFTMSGLLDGDGDYYPFSGLPWCVNIHDLPW